MAMRKTRPSAPLRRCSKSRISKVLKTLSYREREIIKLRYGLGDGYSYTLGRSRPHFQSHPRTHSPDRSQGGSQAAAAQPGFGAVGLPRLVDGQLKLKAFREPDRFVRLAVFWDETVLR